jgi:hypothetical protein
MGINQEKQGLLLHVKQSTLINGSYSSTNSTGIINVTNGGTLHIASGESIYNGNATNDTANININGGILVVEGTIENGYIAGSTGNVTISNGSFNLGSSGEIPNGAGTPSLTIFGANFSSGIPSGAVTIPNGQTMTIPSNSAINTYPSATLTNDGGLVNNGTIFNFGTTVNNPAKTLTNNGTIFVFEGSTFTNNGTLAGTGSITDLTQPFVGTFPDTPLIIPAGASVGFVEGSVVTLVARTINQSPNTFDIYGKTYIYNTLENGDGIGAGTVNIHYPGALYLIGGTLTNGHANSVVNVKQGGSLYNYYGTVDLETGGSDSLDIKQGGKFHNIRGNNPGTFTLSNACQFLDSNEINLDSDLDIDYTWTITEKAVINGYGNKITFGTNGKIMIQGDSASLLLDDVILQDISGNKIHCTDNNTTLSIHNVTWIQDSNFTLTKGKLYVTGDWIIRGNDTSFIYFTDQTSIVAGKANISMISTTFDYQSTTPNLLTLTDNTSIIHLDRGTFLATENCTLANGTLLTTGNAILQGTGTLDLQSLDGIHTTGATTHIGNVIV